MKTMLRPAAAFLIVAALAFAASCGDDKKSPTGSSASPTPTPTPVPTPTPTPTPTPGAEFACGATIVSGGGGCSDAHGPVYGKAVEDAIDFAIATGAGTAGNKITSTGKYVLAVLGHLEDAGYCVDYDGEELNIKRNNDFQENYDIVLASGFIRRGTGSFRVRCTPAQFPLPQEPIFPVGGCLPGASREKVCGRDDDGAVMLDPIEAAINHALALRPTNYRDQHVIDGHLYQTDVVDALKAAGFCAKTNFEEVSVKLDNEFSENYDILLANNTLRRGRGAYRVSCWPAGF